jgi:Protein of unknown function (DUF1566)
MGTFIKLAVVLAVVFGGWKIWHDKHKAQAHVFEVHGEEAYDAATNLTWKRCSVGQIWSASGCDRGIPGYRWEVAQHAGDDKWRVPNEKELVTLIDPVKADKGQSPAVDTVVFPGILSDGATYWTSSHSSGAKAWYVRFSQGAKGIGSEPGSYLQSEINEYSVHLVRTGR